MSKKVYKIEFKFGATSPQMQFLTRANHHCMPTVLPPDLDSGAGRGTGAGGLCETEGRSEQVP
jgi:hypothetical protein